MATTTHTIKRAIIAVIEGHGGEARQIEIVRALGPEWTTDGVYARLRQTMRQMVASGVLATIRRGVYRVHPTFHRRGFDRRDHKVRQIEKYLVEHCGAAETNKIHDAVGAREIVGGFRDAEHHRTTYALALTPEKFCQDYGPCVWTLTREARKQLPLLGKWADKEVGVKERDGFFEKVGAAFAEARGELDVEAVTAQPDIRVALTVMANAAADAKSEFLMALRSEIREELREKGVTDEYAVTLAMYEREDAVLPLDLYLAFEAGDARLHLIAPPELYRGVASLFGVDAPSLSRGEVIAMSTGNENQGVSSASYGLSP